MTVRVAFMLSRRGVLKPARNSNAEFSQHALDVFVYLVVRATSKCLVSATSRTLAMSHAHLVVCKDPEGVQVHIWCKARALAVSAGDDTRHEAAMAQAVLQGEFMCPIGALPDMSVSKSASAGSIRMDIEALIKYGELTESSLQSCNL